MSVNNETVAAIVAQIRAAAHLQNADSPESVLRLADRLEAAHEREIEDAERWGNHAAMGAVAETIQKVGPLYDAESVGNLAALREAARGLIKEVERYKRLVQPSVAGECDMERALERCKDALAAASRNTAATGERKNISTLN